MNASTEMMFLTALSSAEMVSEFFFTTKYDSDETDEIRLWFFSTNKENPFYEVTLEAYDVKMARAKIHEMFPKVANGSCFEPRPNEGLFINAHHYRRVQ